jgi:aspartate aminotransferase-like enzyme
MSLTPSATAVRTSTRPRLFTPGPVEIPVRILRALSQVPPHHRTDVFRDVYRRVSEDLRWAHQTQGEVLMLAASGTGAMEAAVVNLMAPGKRALCLVGGKFGERWGNICKAYAVPYETIEVPWGHAIPVAEFEKRLTPRRAPPRCTTRRRWRRPRARAGACSCSTPSPASACTRCRRTSGESTWS